MPLPRGVRHGGLVVELSEDWRAPETRLYRWFGVGEWNSQSTSRSRRPSGSRTMWEAVSLERVGGKSCRQRSLLGMRGELTERMGLRQRNASREGQDHFPLKVQMSS